MCGIIGCVGIEDSSTHVLEGLKRLEYRGYDSAGLAIKKNGDLTVRKRKGKISQLEEAFATEMPTGSIGIGHTRWSTHGPPSDENSHPHTSYHGTVAVVHNGIVSNHTELRDRCEELGYRFSSETDTEVIAHLIDYHLTEGMDPDDAVKTTLASLEGSYAVAIVVKEVDGLYAARSGSPLVLGIGDEGYYVASDVPAFLEYTNSVVYLEDGDLVRLTAESYEFLDGTDPADRPVETVDWDAEETSKGSYDHFMQKEIEDQPHSLRNTIDGRIDLEAPAIRLEDFPDGTFTDVDEVHFVACGTSYHAALYAERLFNKRGISASTYRASAYDGSIPRSETTLVIGVTQSGETADTLNALRLAVADGTRTFAVTNVVGSTVTREVESTVYIRAGPEIGVAATKTFSSQVITLALLAEAFAEDIEGATPRDDLASFLTAVDRLPEQIDEMLSTSAVRRLCETYHDREEYFFIGHGLSHCVALEGALKFKEITYQHAEGFAAGELKHGPLALVTPGVPIFTVFNGANDEQTRINAEEAQSRGANIIAVADAAADVDFADEVIPIPSSHPDLSGLLANVQLQLVAYHAARLLDRPIDKPRNLAKSVTVT